MTKFKPCPFCGSNNILGWESQMFPNMEVTCQDCGVYVDFGYSELKTKKAIRNNTIKLWNTRV